MEPISENMGLTEETFLACKQTMDTIPKLAFYLIKNHGFSYVLSGKLKSKTSTQLILHYNLNTFSFCEMF